MRQAGPLGERGQDRDRGKAIWGGDFGKDDYFCAAFYRTFKQREEKK